MTLEAVQKAFQARLLNGDDAILEHLGDGARLLKAYDHAYTARLTEVLEQDFEGLHTLVGDAAFADMADAYIHAHPSQNKSVRWFGEHLAPWLAETPPWNATPAIADMAALEWGLGLAFDAPDAVPLTAEALSEVPPAAWPGLVFTPHPALHLFALSTSVMDFHLALEEDRDPDGPPVPLAPPETWAVWRQPETLMVRYRALPPDEAALAKAMMAGETFAHMAEALAATGDAETAAARAAGYLSAWIGDGWITGVGDATSF